VRRGIRLEIAPYLIFFLAGPGFGFAAPGRWRWTPVVFPLALALGAAYGEGIDWTLLIRLVVALLVTVGGVLLGVLLDRRGQRPRYA
jgi:hypothetical protein